MKFPPYSDAQVANAELIRSFWLNYVPDHLAIAFVANADRETSLNPHAVGDRNAAFNIGQWHWPRGQAILAATGIDVRTAALESALTAMHWELTHLETKAWTSIRATSSLDEAAQAICRLYERAGARNALTQSVEKAALWAKYFGFEG